LFKSMIYRQGSQGGEMLTSMQQIRDRALTLPVQTVAVACAHDAEALKAVAEAHALGLARFILVGDAEKTRRLADAMELDISHFELVDACGEACGAAATVQVVASGRAQILLKGFVDSSVLFKAVLDRNAGLRNGSTVSHTVVMDVPGFEKLYLLTDAAMIIKPDLETKRQIVLNAVKVARALGNPDPVVGVLCESEKVNPKMPATMDAAALVEMNRDGRLPGCRVGGPYALDNAISVQAARHKGMDDPLAGLADILLAPDLAAGNIFYKSLMYFARARSAGVVMGTKAPVLLNSRADSHETKINAVALGVIIAAARAEGIA
jgi:phosphate butyryltransferase